MRTALLLISTMLSMQIFAEQLVLPEMESISDETLEASRGKLYQVDIDYISATSDIDGISTGNTAINNRTGNNVITNDALSGASGITNVIQNTGNNVLIQSATVVNLTLHE